MNGVFDGVAKSGVAQSNRDQCDDEKCAPFKPGTHADCDGEEHQRHDPECPAGHDGHEPIQRGAGPFVIDEKKEL